MPVDTIFFMKDKLHPNAQRYPGTYAEISGASSTRAGYSMYNVTDTNYATAWKPSDGTGDEYIQLSGSASAWLGALGPTAYCVVAYDATGADQTVFDLRADTAIGGAYATSLGTFTLNKTGGPTVDYISWVKAASYRYHRLYQFNAARGGGTATAKVFAWSYFDSNSDIIFLTAYSSDAEGPGAYAWIDRCGAAAMMGGFLSTNLNGNPGQEFDVTFDEASKTLWEGLRGYFAQSNWGRWKACYLQYEGLKNYALANFQMVRLARPDWNAARRLVDQYSTSIRLMTEPIT